ncbi:metalloregulator ArsR/SmtB family transcription factor [Aliifodinibius sp. S!AR15-10]|uniref:ArsR/SmtB family transcription factor n=1 Tax=Aliifodinibius sp. S!AR15-10 TaxID=2950437 RepID=UPI00285BFA17|nr:metalloregulator ArsR/SmtB family transcription factor [Aliifodinibius sp. S!AR15-10]MDR8393970.1 metalloregulator ArsR/SmtB family transcription factor [Aliifodinibius sp. S!AR15-10]
MLDSTLHALADSTRRDILMRLADEERSVNEIAEPYDISLAAVSKHLKVLERANLVVRRKEGRKYLCRMNYEPLVEVSELIKTYRKFWEARFDELEQFLEEQKDKENS